MEERQSMEGLQYYVEAPVHRRLHLYRYLLKVPISASLLPAAMLDEHLQSLFYGLLDERNQRLLAGVPKLWQKGHIGDPTF